VQIAVGNRPVALKVLNRKLLDDPEFCCAFRMKPAHRTHSPRQRCHYLRIGASDDGTPYLAMEYLEGETLRAALETARALAGRRVRGDPRADGARAERRPPAGHYPSRAETCEIFLTRGDEGESARQDRRIWHRQPE